MSMKFFMFSLAAIVAAAAIAVYVALQLFTAGDVLLVVGVVAAGAIIIALVARFGPPGATGSGRYGSGGGWWGGTYGGGDGGGWGGDGGGWGGGDGGGGGGCGGGGG